MKYRISVFFILVIGLCQISHAGIEPVVVFSEIKNDTWFPLPLEQMKDAAVDTALTRISETGDFAFLFNSDKITKKNAGILKLKVALIEPAASAKITIILTLANQGRTYVSSSSISLDNKDYKGIFNALQQLGMDGADQIVMSIGDLQSKNDISNDENEARKNIISLNKKLINLTKSVNDRNLYIKKINNHNSKVMKSLAKLDTIIYKLDKHFEYEKKSDLEKNKKLDEIYVAIQKLNVGVNTNNVLPGSEELTEYDVTQLPKLNQAYDLKYKKKFSNSRKILNEIYKDKKISSLLRSAVKEELNINLPIYEADILKNNLADYFKKPINNNDYYLKLSYIVDLYNNVLKQPDLSYTKRKEIRTYLSKFQVVIDAINASVATSRTAKDEYFLRVLKSIMQRHITNLSVFNGKYSGTGQCPYKSIISKEMEKANINSTIVSYQAINENECELKVKNFENNLITYIFNEDGAKIQ